MAAHKARLREQRQVHTYEVDCPHDCDDDYLIVTLERSRDVDSEITVSVERRIRGHPDAGMPA